MASQALSAQEAQQLRKGDRVRVQRATSSRTRLYILTQEPHTVAGWVLLTVALVKVDEPGAETLSRHDHVVQVPTEQVWRDQAVLA